LVSIDSKLTTVWLLTFKAHLIDSLSRMRRQNLKARDVRNTIMVYLHDLFIILLRMCM